MSELINGRTPEEIKRGLSCKMAGQHCNFCSYQIDCISEDGDPGVINRDALALIERLEAERDAALAKAPRWISVKDELPPKHLRVLLMNGHRMVASGYLTYVKDKCGTYLWCMDGVRRNDVTHWAKLPEPQKEK